MEKVMPHTAKDFLTNLKTQLLQAGKIRGITDTLVNYEGIMPIFGAEIEFYITPNIEFANFSDALQQDAKAANLKYDLVREKGKNQFEVIMPPTNDGEELASSISKIRDLISCAATQMGGRAIFDAKPFNNDFGSAMHFHISFVVTRSYIDVEKVRDKDYLNKDDLKIMGRRMCCLIPDTFLVFAPDEADYRRFVPGYDAPINVSFSNNNRTVPVRTPENSPPRLEHRVACASADPYLALVALMQGVSMGQYMTDRVFNVPIIEGSAYRAKYNLEPFPRDIDQACEKFDPRIFKM